MVLGRQIETYLSISRRLQFICQKIVQNINPTKRNVSELMWCDFSLFSLENAACTLGNQSTVRPGALFTSAFLFRKNQTASNVPKSPLKISEFRDVFWLNNVKKTADLVKRGTSLKCFVNVFGFWVSGSSIREHWQSWKGLLTDVQHSIDPRCKLDKKYIHI